MGQCRFRALSAFVWVLATASVIGLASVVPVGAQPLGTAFPYQGRLQDNGTPANGLYDFQFQIYNAAIGGAQVGPTVVRDDVAVSGGLFTTSLDFGGGVFTGSARWLEIAVRPGASGDGFTPIGGRQELQPTPNALFAAATAALVPPVTITHATNDPVLNVNQTGTGGYGGFFRASNVNHVGSALYALSEGNGNGITAVAKQAGRGIAVGSEGTGEALFASASNSNAIRASINTSANPHDAVAVITEGTGDAVDAKIDNTNSSASAIKGEINTALPGAAAAIRGTTTGTGGVAGFFHATNIGGNGAALVALASGDGNAIRAEASGFGNGVETVAESNGSALYAWIPTFGTGRAIRVNNFNVNNDKDIVSITNAATIAPHVTVRASDSGGREARLATDTHAGYFVGNVHVTGTLSKGAGAFRIDHPLDPANKYLSHSFVESPDMKNVYDGVATLDANGEASVTLPHYFEALNRDFRYQLTAVGGPAPSLHVASKINNGVFRIAGGTPGLEISWQITGIRKDQTALHNPIVVEEDKKEDERGFYLNPAAYGLPAEKGIGWQPREERTTASPNPQ